MYQGLILRLKQPLLLLCLLSSSQIMADDRLVLDTIKPSQNCTGNFSPSDGYFDFLATPPVELPPNSTINRIHITPLPIFNEADPKENNFIFRFANRFHKLTMPENIQQQLLIKSGDPYNLRLIDESSRLLRQLNHLYEATVVVRSICGDQVDLEVITKDVWSLNLELSFGRSGGENTHRFGITESNLFGLGKEISLVSKRDNDRSTTRLAYKDNNLFGTRIRTTISTSNSDDGSSALFDINLPFFALDSNRAWGLRLEQGDRIDTQYFRGDDISEVVRDVKDYSVFYGFSDGNPPKTNGKNSVVHRWRVGYRYFEERFSDSDDLLPPPISPRDQELSYPFVQFEAIEDDYTTGFNFDRINRTEDLHLGYSFRTSLGYASTSFGSNQDKVIYNGQFRDTLTYNPNILLQHTLDWQGIWNQDRDSSEDIQIQYDIKYFRSQPNQRSFFAKLNAVWTRNLNTNRQIVLGGDTGVRGFDQRLQTGDRRVVLTLEERQYTNYHLLNLAYLGFAAFIDIGRAWSPDVDTDLEDKILADVGFGIRLASSKTDGGRIVHIDFAFPITNRDDPDVDGFQVAVSIKNSF